MYNYFQEPLPYNLVNYAWSINYGPIVLYYYNGKVRYVER